MAVAKAEQYATYKRRYKAAMSSCCYLECLLIEYAMMEDRLLSILFHLGIVNRQDEVKPTWVKRPQDMREGYRRCLASIITKRGSMPPLRTITSKLQAIKVLTALEDPLEECPPYERWLRTEVKKELTECDASRPSLRCITFAESLNRIGSL